MQHTAAHVGDELALTATLFRKGRLKYIGSTKGDFGRVRVVVVSSFITRCLLPSRR